MPAASLTRLFRAQVATERGGRGAMDIIQSGHHRTGTTGWQIQNRGRPADNLWLCAILRVGLAPKLGLDPLRSSKNSV